MFNLVRGIFNFFILRNPYKYFLIIGLFLFSIAVFSPVVQVEWEIFNQQEQILNKSKRFDFKYRLPDKKEFEVLKKRNLVSQPTLKLQQILEKLLKKKQTETNNFDYFLGRFSEHTDFTNKKEFIVQVGFVKDQKINKVVLLEGKRPQKNMLEVVLNQKYAQLNNIKIGQYITLYKKKFKVVGFGEAAHNLSLGFYHTFSTLGKFQYKDDLPNLYKTVALVYINESLFNLMENNNIIKNYRTYLFLKFRTSEENVNKLDRYFQDQIYKEINYSAQKTSFESDLASGLKRSFSFFELLFILIIVLLFACSLLFLVRQLSINAFKASQKKIFFLYQQGYSRSKLSFSYFLIIFFSFLAASIIGYFLGFFLYSYFLKANNKLFFTLLELKFFDWFFVLFLTTFFPLLFGIVAYLSFFCSFNQNKNRFKKMVFMPKFLINLSFLLKQKLISFFFSWPKLKIFFIFLFRDFWYKFFAFFFVFFMFLTAFLILFMQVSSDNFLYKQMSFLNKDVKNVTDLKGIYGSAYLKSRDNFIHSDTFLVSDDGLKENPNMQEVKSLELETLLSNKLNHFCLINPNEKKILSNIDLACLFRDRFIDYRSIASPSLKKYLKRFNIESIYFNTVPYNVEKDLPLLVFDFKMQRSKGKLYFLKDKWHQFFNIHYFSEKLPNWDLQIDENNNYYLGKDPKEGIYYAIVPEHFKNWDYQLGDTFDADIFLNHQKLSYKHNTSKNSHKFKIAAFVKDEFLIPNNIFVDHDYLEKGGFIDQKLESNQTPFNQIISKDDKKHLFRNLVLTLSLNKLDELEKIFKSKEMDFNDMFLLNLRSFTLKEITDFSAYHFKIFRIYLIIILVFTLFVIFVLLFLVLSFFTNKQSKTNLFLLKIGYRIQDLVFFNFFFFLLLLSLGAVFAMLLSYYLFSLLMIYFSDFDVFLVVSNVWDYLGYFIAFFVFVLILDFFYNFIYLKYKILKKI